MSKPPEFDGWVEELRGLPDYLRVYPVDARVIVQGIDALKAEITRLRPLLTILAADEAYYRNCHDIHGAGDIRTGRAWDMMRQSGDKARAVLEGKVNE